MQGMRAGKMYNNMQVELFTLTDNIHGEAALIELITVLMKDRKLEIEKEIADPSTPDGPGAYGWQNLTVEGLLQSAVARAEPTNDIGESNSWERVAQIIHAGKTYE